MPAKGSKSKKRSVASSVSNPPPEDPTFFLDRGLGRRVVAEALRAEGVRVELHDDHFDQDTDDATWVAEVGRRGWIILTKDKHIRSNQQEVESLISAGVPCFNLTGGNLTGEKMAAAFVAALDTMRRMVSKLSPPFVATVSGSGNVRLLLRYTDLVKRLE